MQNGSYLFLYVFLYFYIYVHCCHYSLSSLLLLLLPLPLLLLLLLLLPLLLLLLLLLLKRAGKGLIFHRFSLPENIIKRKHPIRFHTNAAGDTDSRPPNGMSVQRLTFHSNIPIIKIVIMDHFSFPRFSMSQIIRRKFYELTKLQGNKNELNSRNY